jgi:hypothetical protein
MMDVRRKVSNASRVDEALRFDLNPISLLYSPDCRVLWATTITSVIKIRRDTPRLKVGRFVQQARGCL